MRKAIIHLKKTDPVLRRIIESVGPYKMRYREPVFETLVRSIVFQQLSGKAAGTIYGRLAEVTGEPIRPEAILALSTETMRALGLSRQKIAYITDLAQRYDEMPPPAELARLGEPWAPFRSVASWYLWRSLEETPDL